MRSIGKIGLLMFLAGRSILCLVISVYFGGRILFPLLTLSKYSSGEMLLAGGLVFPSLGVANSGLELAPLLSYSYSCRLPSFFLFKCIYSNFSGNLWRLEPTRRSVQSVDISSGLFNSVVACHEKSGYLGVFTGPSMLSLA